MSAAWPKWTAPLALASLLALLALATPRAAAATDPGSAGPFTAGLQTVAIPASQGSTLSTDVHFPLGSGGGVDPAAGACPVIVFGHGFSRSKAQYVNVGAQLATRGFITLIPNFSGSDHSKNAADLRALIDWITARNADAGSIFLGRVDTAAVGAAGHSAGGLSAILAAAQDARIRACALRDPVDNNGLGVAALSSVHVPVAVTYSEDSSCNAGGSARTLYAAALMPKRGIQVVGGTHCDPEDPTNALCTLFCGSANSTRQRLYRRYTTDWFEYYLRCDATYAEWVYGAQAQADLAAARITFDSVPPGLGPPCVAPGEVRNLLARRAGSDLALTWDPVSAVPPVSEYRIYRSPSPDFLGPALAGTAAGTSSTEALSASPEPAFFKVAAFSSAGEGPR